MQQRGGTLMPIAAQKDHAEVRGCGEVKNLTQSRRGAEFFSLPANLMLKSSESSAQRALNILSSASPRLRVNNLLCASAALRELFFAGTEH